MNKGGCMNKNESGRSMVEMLAVLAIIGILSIGGIAGYTMAINRYHAGQFFDFALKSASETTGGGLVTHEKTFLGVRMIVVGIDNDESGLRDGDVCIDDWGTVSDDIITVFEKRAIPYRISGNENCYRFTQNVD